MKVAAGPAFALYASNEAHVPPEARGLARDSVRMLVSDGHTEPVDTTFRQIGTFLRPGDLLVVNTTATIPAALDGQLPDGEPVVMHLSGVLPGDVWLVEVRRPDHGTTLTLALANPCDVALLGGGKARLLAPFAASQRLWLARLDIGMPPEQYAAAHGRPIRYRHVPAEWPISFYQTIFARTPGSAEMASASRPFSHELVTELVSRGISIAPLLLHTGVSSQEGGEAPYPERYDVPGTTAEIINLARRHGGRVVAAGTTVVRALETVTDGHGRVHPGHGWTDLVVGPEHPVQSVDGLLTGWHEPESSHLQMLQAVAGARVLGAAYQRALDLGYLWHELGDSHLILRDSGGRASP